MLRKQKRIKRNNISYKVVQITEKMSTSKIKVKNILHKNVKNILHKNVKNILHKNVNKMEWYSRLEKQIVAAFAPKKQ